MLHRIKYFCIGMLMIWISLCSYEVIAAMENPGWGSHAVVWFIYLYTLSCWMQVLWPDPSVFTQGHWASDGVFKDDPSPSTRRKKKAAIGIAAAGSGYLVGK